MFSRVGMPSLPFALTFNGWRKEGQQDGRGDERRCNDLLSLGGPFRNLGGEVANCQLRKRVCEVSGENHFAKCLVSRRQL